MGVVKIENEYKMLREEIISNLKQMHQYFALTSTAVFAVLAYIFNNPNNPNIFIAMFVVLICISTRIRRILESNVSISTYIEVFLEPKIDGRKWETYNHYKVRGYNSHNISKRNLFFEILFFRTNSTYLLLGVIMYCIHLLVLIKNFSLFGMFLGGIINTISLLILLYNALFDANNKHRDKYLDYWKKVKEETTDVS